MKNHETVTVKVNAGDEELFRAFQAMAKRLKLPVTVQMKAGEVFDRLMQMPEGDPACKECDGSGWRRDYYPEGMYPDDPNSCQVGRCRSCMPPTFVVVDGRLLPGTLEHFEKVDGKWVLRNSRQSQGG